MVPFMLLTSRKMIRVAREPGKAEPAEPRTVLPVSGS